MKTFLKQILSGVRGEYSHKRVITLIAFALLAIAFVSNLFWQIPISEFLIDNFVYIVLGGMGIATAEPMANRMLGRERKDKE